MRRLVVILAAILAAVTFVSTLTAGAEAKDGTVSAVQSAAMETVGGDTK
jgi:hypothetical protein